MKGGMSEDRRKINFVSWLRYFEASKLRVSCKCKIIKIVLLLAGLPVSHIMISTVSTI